MQPLKILHIIWSTEMGGISKVVLHLCQEQQKDESLQVSVFCAKGKSALFETFEKCGISIVAGKFTNALNIDSTSKMEYKKMMSNVDIIHFHSYNPLLASFAKKKREKIVYSEHGNFGFGRKVRINDLVVRWMQKKFLNKYIHAITFNSNFTKEKSISRFDLHHSTKEVIYNGVPENATSHNAQNFFRKNNHEFLIATIGRLASVKRFDRLLLALSKTENSNFKLLIMGTGPEESELRNLVAEFNLSTKVFFVGQGDSIQLLKESNICIISSQGEAFGLVAIEAYQQGKQVLVFEDGGGVTEIVRQLDPLSVVKNEHEMAKLITHLIQHPIDDEANIVARKNYSAQYSMSIMASKIKKLYLSI
ncbi:MAG: glycosyltransferase family 4 protein [Bacteroidetes bacterium]|nr:glycosyltransferase family 4 protein [Bacteroidota bacterium]